MFELLLTLCLTQNPTNCWERHVPFLEMSSARECLSRAQYEAVHVVEDHPDWQVRRLKCQAAAA
jgi:hypothetical protein